MTENLTLIGRCSILAVAFLGWLFAGVHMSITQLTGQPAAIDLLNRTGDLEGTHFQALLRSAPTMEKEAELSAEDQSLIRQWKPMVARWFAWFQCAFLFGAAAGGLGFGWLGDRVGRSKAMTASILTYSAFAAATALAQSALQFWLLWFLACTGVGGMWPNGVALVAEVWSGMSRPVLAGVIGTAANIGLFLMSTIARAHDITADDWRWAMLVGAAPLVLGLIALFVVPESPRWLASRGVEAPVASASGSSGVFRQPLLGVTLLAILLATVPMIGGWGTTNWMNPWADATGNPSLKAEIGQARAFTGIAGSLLGGWFASLLGRRTTYFLVSLASLGLAQYIFWLLLPTDADFLIWVAALGFVSGIYFGWLPLCLPELFPTRVRSTGAGVGFNFGRIVTAVTVFATGALSDLFHGDYARIGRITSLLFLLGMVGIWLSPDTSRKALD
jgi:MFS family permease